MSCMSEGSPRTMIIIFLVYSYSSLAIHVHIHVRTCIHVHVYSTIVRLGAWHVDIAHAHACMRGSVTVSWDFSFQARTTGTGVSSQASFTGLDLYSTVHSIMASCMHPPHAHVHVEALRYSSSG